MKRALHSALELVAERTRLTTAEATGRRLRLSRGAVALRRLTVARRGLTVTLWRLLRLAVARRLLLRRRPIPRLRRLTITTLLRRLLTVARRAITRLLRLAVATLLGLSVTRLLWLSVATALLLGLSVARLLRLSVATLLGRLLSRISRVTGGRIATRRLIHAKHLTGSLRVGSPFREDPDMRGERGRTASKLEQMPVNSSISRLRTATTHTRYPTPNDAW